LSSSSGVAASLSADAILARLLGERFPLEPFTAPHRIRGLVARF